MSRTVLVTSLAWTCALVCLWFWSHALQRDNAADFAKIQAKTFYDTEIFLHERDPELHKYVGPGPIRVHRLPIDPLGDRSDVEDWEAWALEELERGADQFVQVVSPHGNERFRWMGPIRQSQVCARCHDWPETAVGALRGGVAITLPMAPIREISRADGSRRRLLFLAFWASGMLIQFLGIGVLARRMREHDRTTEELEKVLRATEMIVQNVPFGAVIVGRDRRVRYVNSVASGILGAKPAELEGRLCHDSFCAGEGGACPILDGNQTGETAERQLLRADGTHVPVFKTVIPVRWHGEEALLEAFLDISGHERSQRDLEARLRQEMRLNRLATKRELRMVRLKQEVNDLLTEMGRESRYKAPETAAVEVAAGPKER